MGGLTGRVTYRGVLVVIFGMCFVGVIFQFGGLSSQDPMMLIKGHYLSDFTQQIPPKYRNVAIASAFGSHYDVYMTVAWTLKRLKEPLNFSVYAAVPFRHQFQRIIDENNLYDGEYKKLSNFLPDVANNTGEGAIDMIILGTCEIDLKNWGVDLLAAWDNRDNSSKFKLVCIVHNADDKTWQAKIPEWSRRNAIRILPISAHVKENFHQMFLDRAREPDPVIRSAGMEHIPVDAHIPILDLKDLPVLSASRRLSNAVIQGSFMWQRRDYPRIFSQLNQSLHDDPYAWGYLPPGKSSASLMPDSTADGPPFKLHLVGSGSIDVPEEIKNLIVFHTNLDYASFYRIMAGMDVCIPAFLAIRDQNYKRQASSSIAMCMEVNVPVLAMQELRNAYTYIDDNRVTVTHPAAMSEIDALKALRTGDSSAFLASDPSGTGITMGSNPVVWDAVAKMMQAGWIRTKEGFDTQKRQVWKENEEVIRRILRGL